MLFRIIIKNKTQRDKSIHVATMRLLLCIHAWIQGIFSPFLENWWLWMSGKRMWSISESNMSTNRNAEPIAYITQCSASDLFMMLFVNNHLWNKRTNNNEDWPDCVVKENAPSSTGKGKTNTFFYVGHGAISLRLKTDADVTG